MPDERPIERAATHVAIKINLSRESPPTPLRSIETYDSFEYHERFKFELSSQAISDEYLQCIRIEIDF